MSCSDVFAPAREHPSGRVFAQARAWAAQMRLRRMDLKEVERLGGAEGAARHLRALVPGGADVEEAVREIVAGVRERGDEAVFEYSRRFDAAAPESLLVTSHELDEAMASLSTDVYAGLETAIANVAQVAAAGIQEDVSVALPQGQHVVLREVPVSSVAVYVPGGRSPYPSTVVMGTVTARAAGVLEVSVCAPPGRQGHVDATTLAACRLCGVSRVYCMGGAQAVAALAHGTATVDPVDVIVGPGNLYVQEAKRQLSGTVGIDGFAGPSDLLIVFDEDVDPELVALDMLAQAEHGPGTLVAALSSSPSALGAVAERVGALAGRAQDAEEAGEAVGVLVQVRDERAGLGLANAFAPEHLQLMGARAEALAPFVQSAGCVFVGTASATAFGDYVAGSNHVLPTGGVARFSSGLSTRVFRRRMSEVRLDAESARALAPAGAAIARSEGFPMHARSMVAREGDARTAPAGEGDEERRAGGV
jgi:histidinol dehydrogenase